MKSARGVAVIVALASVLVAVVVPSARAQAGAASLTVVVKDNYGVLPGASVRVVKKDTQAASRGVTDSAGVASFGGLAAGNYAVRSSLSGFADTEQSASLAAGEKKTVEIVLSLAQFSTTVTVTTANRREELLLDVANPTTLIDESQIGDTGARSAKDLLVEQNGQGIQVQPGGGQGHVSINGVPNSGVLVLVNGRRYIGKDANGSLNLEDLQLPGIEKIEVVKGAGSALYGTEAMGGVINFITKQGGAPGFTNKLDFTGGSYSDLRVNDNLGWRGSKGGFTAFGGYRTYDGFDLDENNPQTIGQPASKWKSAGLNGDVQLATKLVARVMGDYSERNIDPYYFSGATQAASTVYNSIRDLTRYTISPELEYTPGSSTSFNATYNWGKYLRDETRVFTVGGRVVPQAPWREWNQELKLIGRHGFKAFGADNPLQGGYERRNEKLSRGTLAPPTASNPLGLDEKERDINVFWMQQEIVPSKALKITGGFRYDSYSDFGDEWSPKLALVVSPTGNHRIRGSYGHGFRAPSFGELYLSQPPFFVGNPNLLPETSDTFTGGYSYAGPKLQIGVDYSYAKVKNGITFANITPSLFTYANVSRYNAKAFNSSVSVSLPAGFAPSLSYTWLQRENDQGQRLSAYPTNAFFAKLLWSHPRLGLRANFRGQINGEQPPSLTDSSYVPAYDVWYVQVAKKLFTRGAHAIGVFAQVDNLFDEKNIFRVDKNGNPVPNDYQIWLAPRTFQAGITVDMDWTK
jgi:outer membrane receptor for ferrienterochelin and colicins